MVETGSLLTNILAPASYFWAIPILIIIYFIVALFMKSKTRPEEQPYYGAKVREDMTKKQIKSRTVTWGTKSNKTISRGWDKIGKVIRIEPVYKAPVDEKGKPIPGGELKELWNISFRNMGFSAWIMAQIGRYKHAVIDPDVITKKEKELIIDPKAALHEDSGVWTLERKDHQSFINDLNLKKDLENAAGFVSDFPRRLSNLHPQQAIQTERQQLDADLQEKAKQNRISNWVKG